MLIEDEKKIRDLLSLYLTQDGHQVMAFSHAEEALNTFENHDIDVVITDLMLPGLQGEALLNIIRKTSKVYVLVITAKTADDDKLKLLKDGADDYISKPFKIEEILYKLKNIEARIKKTNTTKFIYEQTVYTLDLNAMHVHVDQDAVALNKTECDLLSYFLEHANQTLTRQQIIDHVLSESEAYDRIVDTYVKNLRQKLGSKVIIESVYGAGYRFKGETHD